MAAEPAPTHDPEPEPAPEPEPEPAPAPQPEVAREAPAPPAGGLALVDVRRLWPDIVEAVKSRRRLTWIHLTQHAQVVAVDGTTLTLGFSNAGARESFDGGGSAEIVRQAAIDVVGHDWRVETIVDPGAQPATAAPPAPRTAAPAPSEASAGSTPAEPSPASVEPPGWVEPPSASARQAISPTRSQSDEETGAPPVDGDGGARPDDVDAQTTGLDGAQLLQEALGAEVIEEIPHQ
jgi:DNA polymerase-3 subunit gamma/tau